MIMHQVTSLREIASFCISLLWILTTTTTVAMTTTPVVPTTTTTTTTMTTSQATGGDDNDGGFCRTQFVSSETGREGAGQTTVAMAAILELRRPKDRGCGAVSSMGLQVTAALLWAVRKLNGEGLDPGVGPFIPGLRIELRVYDDCSHDLLAARHIGEMLSIHPDFNCTPAVPPLAGVLGTTTSQTTTRVASLLADTGIPHFGISATLSFLSDNTTYPTFFRTVPSDLTQSKVLVDLVKYLNWTYVAGIYTNDIYGTEGFQEFKRLAARAGVCVFKEKSFIHSENSLEDNMEKFVRELLIDIGHTRYGSLGIVYFGHDREADILFQMINERRSRWHDQAKVDKLHWLFSDGVGTSLSIADKIQQYTSKHVSISSATSPLDDVMDFYLQALDNPRQLGPYWEALATEYLRDNHHCYETTSAVSKCKLRDKVKKVDYLSAAMDSLYSLAALLSDASEKSCGAGSSGVCQAMLEAVNEGLLKLVQPQALNYSLVFSEDRLPREFVEKGRMLVPDEFRDFVPASSPLYFINSASLSQWTKIGEYCNGSLTIEPNSGMGSVLSSECGIDCQECKESDVIHYAYRPGDVIILGLYSISSPGAKFSCGEYRNQSSSVAALLAFLHTVETMNSGPANGKRFGALVLDDCYNKLTASALMSDLFSGKTTLTDPTNGEAIDMSKVVAVVGSQSSSVTLSMLSILTPLEIPTISYSATSPDLDDNNAFPFFLRTVPSDSLQASALVQLVQEMNVTFVGALYQDNNYGLRGIRKFEELAKKAGICVENPLPVNVGDSEGSLRQKLANLRNRDVIVIVTFVLESTAIKLLDAIVSEWLGQTQSLVFLASEAWGVNTDTLQGGRGVAARGSVVLTVDSTKEAGDVKMADYLKGLTTDNDLPWMRDFWENELQCNLPGGFTNSHNTMCRDVKLGDAEALELAVDQKVVQTVNAVASVTTALNSQCENDSNPATCMLSLTAETKTTLIKGVTLQDQKKLPFNPYLDDGNGKVGFTIHNVQKHNGNYGYVKVGTYDPDPNSGEGFKGSLNLRENSLVFYDPVGQPITSISSSCQYKTPCEDVCGQGSKTTPTPPDVSPLPVRREGNSSGLVAAVVVLALLCVLLLLVVATSVFCAKRRGKIPFLGVVKSDAGPVSWRSSQLPGLSMPDSQINMGFSPRTSLPLPPLPRSNTNDTQDGYNVPDDYSTSRLSISSGTSSTRRISPRPRSSSQLGFPEMHGGSEGGSQYNYSSDEGGMRHPSSHQFHPNPQHQEVLQEQRRQEDVLHQRGAVLFPHNRTEAMDSRPRAGSMPQVDRPKSLQFRGRAGHPDAHGGGDEEGPHEMRARSHSADAAFRSRLGALSEDDQQLLMKHLLSPRQQSQVHYFPGQPEQRQTFLTSANVERVPAPYQRRQLTLSPIQSQTSIYDESEPQTPRIVFQNPPPLCTSRSSLFSMPGDDNASLLYLHPILSDESEYLQVLPEPHHPSSAPQSASDSPRENRVVRPSSLPNSLAQQANPRSLPPGTYALSPMVLANPRVSSVTSPMSVFGSPASEGSESVFISPGQEYQPKSAPVRTDGNKGVAAIPETQQTPETASGQIMSAPGTVRNTNLVSPASPQPNRVLSPEGLRRLIAKHNRSPNTSSGSEGTPQTSPQSPGVVVRDSSGALFLVPHYPVPLQQGAESAQPASSPVFFFPQSPLAAQASSLSPSSTPNNLESSPRNSPRKSSADFTTSVSPTYTPNNLESSPRNIPRKSSADVTASLPVSQSPRPQAEPSETLNDLSGHKTSGKLDSGFSSVPYAGSVARAPRMGVDALSAQKRLADNSRLGAQITPTEPNSDNTLDTLKDDSHSNTPQVSASDAATGASQTSPGRAEAPETNSLAAPEPLGRVESVPYIQGYQLVPIPPPCGPTEHAENSSNSDNSVHTSYDSGNGEELLTTDAIDSEVPVMC
ncbi:uncharacterized protein [Littorina saxatilis]|uniref:uncharacterized protein n=1 Tax=Littorina saxatilis TaxID=31220 RepID=UPI0038B5E356